MSIATAIQNAQQKVAAAYTAVSSKGGTLPQTQDLSNLPTAINSISGGGSKFGASIDSFLGNVDSSGILYPANTDTYLSFDGVKKMKDYALYHKFYHDADIDGVTFPDLEELRNSSNMGNFALTNAFSQCTSLTYARFPKLKHIQALNAFNGIFAGCPNLTEINFDNLEYAAESDCFKAAFSSCTNLQSASFPKLTYLVGWERAFSQCSNLTSVSFPVLTTMSGSSCCESIFSQCSNLTSISFPELVTAGSGNYGNNIFRFAFSSCTSLQTMTFPKLASMIGQNTFQYAFSSCTSLTSISFPALNSNSFGNNYTNQFNSMLNGVTGCTVHFPSNLESVIGSWTDVTAGFGGTNTTVLFDLPATE